ncbi:MAG TPA: energy transducer TonB [Blastocatellia bacterium]|nr:energy transducer TonB [Blastocatellia bacterium]
MFDKLIDSTPERRKRRFLRYFFGTSLLYLLAMTAALVASVVLANPEMIHPSNLTVTANVIPPPKGNTDTPHTKQQQATRPTRPDIYNPVPLDQPIPKQETETPPTTNTNPPVGPLIGGPGHPDGVVTGGDPLSPGIFPGPGHRTSPEPAEPPPPPPVVANKQPKPDAQSMLKIPSVVLQGKAIDRRTPVYPRMAIQIKVEGSVAVEVVISPEGRVEVARAISGHPMLKPAAEEAARQWRFQPTLLNGVPVRVTGIITFVFKLNQ